MSESVTTASPMIVMSLSISPRLSGRKPERAATRLLFLCFLLPHSRGDTR